MRTDIPAQRNHAVACECIGYVPNEVIGDEGSAVYSSDVRVSNVFLLFYRIVSPARQGADEYSKRSR
jgi:hypothetical protein